MCIEKVVCALEGHISRHICLYNARCTQALHTSYVITWVFVWSTVHTIALSIPTHLQHVAIPRNLNFEHKDTWTYISYIAQDESNCMDWKAIKSESAWCIHGIACSVFISYYGELLRSWVFAFVWWWSWQWWWWLVHIRWAERQQHPQLIRAWRPLLLDSSWWKRSISHLSHFFFSFKRAKFIVSILLNIWINCFIIKWNHMILSFISQFFFIIFFETIKFKKMEKFQFSISFFYANPTTNYKATVRNPFD